MIVETGTLTGEQEESSNHEARLLTPCGGGLDLTSRDRVAKTTIKQTAPQ